MLMEQMQCEMHFEYTSENPTQSSARKLFPTPDSDVTISHNLGRIVW